MNERVFFSLGSNQGDRLANIEAALRRLDRVCRRLSASRVYETEPLYFLRQPAFLNVAAVGLSTRSPLVLLSAIKSIERSLGRRRSRLNGPRPIDIDILLYGDRIVHGPRLVIPHPRLEERRFALLPLLELAPRAVNPENGVAYWKLLDRAAGGVYFHACSRYTMRSLRPLATDLPGYHSRM